MHTLTILTWTVVVPLLAVLCLYCRLRIVNLRRKLKTAMHNTAEIGNFLYLFSRNIRKSSEISNWMNVTSRYVADLVDAEAVCVFTVQAGWLKAAGAVGAFPKVLRNTELEMNQKLGINRLFGHNPEDSRQAAMEIIEETAFRMEPMFIDNPDDQRLLELEHTSPIRSLMSAPMISEGAVVGVICAVNSTVKTADGIFNRDQDGRFRFIAEQVVLAYDILQVYSRLSEQQRINQELDFARNLQRSMLPMSVPVWGKFEVHASTRSSKEVSGDFYDFVQMDEDRLMVVIGDASGKGIPACMIMAMTRSFIRANISRYTTLKEFVNDLNENLFRDAGEGRFITLGICVLNRRESTMEYVRAGHTELIMYVRNHTRSINPEGAALGILPRELAEFDTFRISFSPEMELLLYTDGINEATNEKGDYFGVDRIKDQFMKSCLAHEPPQETVGKIMDSVYTFANKPESLADDQTIVIIRHA